MPCVLPTSPGYFFDTSVTELGRRLRSGQLSCVQLAEAALASISRLNPQLNAFVHVNTAGALAQAALADAALAAGQDAGPLHGIPVAIKDNIDTFDMPTTYGSAHFAEHQPRQDAICVARLREAGAVILGKTLTHEFAYGPTGDRSLQGASRNPWDTRRMTGGSSAGSAAAVAAGLVPLALGTDTGGSIRIPSGLCRAVGFKPGIAAVPMTGIFPLCKTLDHVGPIANSVEDAALVYGVISRSSAPASAADRAPRVGWVDPRALGPVDEQVLMAVKSRAMQLFGGSLEVVDGFDELVPTVKSAMAAIQRSEAYAVHARRVDQQPQLFDAEVLERLHMSAQVRGWEYVAAMEARQVLRAKMAEYFQHYDVLLMPTLPTTAPAVDLRELVIDGEKVSVRDAVLSLTSVWNLTGLPAISVPAGMVDGLPVGLQAVAAQHGEWPLLQWLQQRHSALGK
ncbi:amidase [Pseudomonas sp. UBA4194]|uniref:amidase n=1 Tax=Pseudomonas sp. UBA4194 TaxID=1947317 RepID=UPI0025F2B505|nr:amidase [Pseudomonas sp. UBA4194]